MLRISAMAAWLIIGSTSLTLVAQTPNQVDGAAQADQVVPLWPKQPPTWTPPTEKERDTTPPDGGRMVAGKRVIRLGNVAEPQLHVFPAGQQSDTAILIAPGGGYSILAWDLEGTEIATWLNELGITAIVVKYRVPTRNTEPRWLPAVQDIQRGIRLVRSGAIDGVSVKRIGVLGFSAGGNASARVATARKRLYDPVDASDHGSVQPDFAVLVYPAWLVQQDDDTKLIDDLSVDSQTPPMFLAHAADDRVSCMSSVAMFSALKRNNVTASLHVFSRGGHGYGARKTGQPTDAWPRLCETWLGSQGWLNQ